MNIAEQHKLFRQLMWDYHIPVADIEKVLRGKKDLAGHYRKQAIFIKLIESFSGFTIVQLFSPAELRQLLTDDLVKKLRFNSLRTKYEFVQKRLQQVEFVNDVQYHVGTPVKTSHGTFDTVANILAN